MMKILKAIDLFSGAGGTTAGLKKSGIQVVSAVEIDSNAGKTYKFNNPEVNLIIDDIKNIKKEDLDESIKENDQLLLVACPPCQGFSSIRRGGELDVRNQLVFEFLRLINEMKPEYILMENVSGMSRGKGKKIFSKFYAELIKFYNVTFDILNAADYGVPQIRKRLVLHGIRKKIAIAFDLKIELPSKTHSKNGNKLPKWINSSIIMDLPSINAGESYIDPNNKIFNHIANGLSELNKKRIIYIRKHGGSRDCLPPSLTKNWHRNLNLHKDVYGILDIKKPAITITGGCMNFSKGRFGHPRDNRALSAREAARLQSFDDDYIFFGNKSQLASQIGNAVPVKLAESSGKYFVNLNKEMLFRKRRNERI